MTSGVPYAEVIGDPVSHSKSPLIHRFWLARLGFEADYRATRIERGGVASYLAERMADPNWRGCNVTMPLKVEALRLAHRPSAGAALVGAANIMRSDGAALVADNSDVLAIRRLIRPLLPDLLRKVYVMGTGGAARAALAALQPDFATVMIGCRRNQEDARQLYAEFGFGGTVGAIGQPDLIGTADLIINATPLGMVGQESMPADVLSALQNRLSDDTVVFDMVTSPAETELLRTARTQGLRTISGLEMLVEQAAVSFEQFFGTPAPRDGDPELMKLLTA